LINSISKVLLKVKVTVHLILILNQKLSFKKLQEKLWRKRLRQPEQVSLIYRLNKITLISKMNSINQILI